MCPSSFTMADSGQRGMTRPKGHARLAEARPDIAGDWKAIGPYLSERAWGARAKGQGRRRYL
jgi:hypothetical protein